MKPFYEKDVPKEVKEYMIMVASMGGMMGLEMYQKCKAIEEKYPQWFPWQHKYKSVSQEVHDAYERERKSSLKKEETISSPVTITTNEDLPLAQDILNVLEQVIEWENRQREKAAQQREKDKSLWDKHYKKFGLEFRG